MRSSLRASSPHPDGQKATPAPGVPKLTALDELEAIYATVPVGLCVLDTNLRYVRINNLLAEINGISVADHLGKTVREIVPDLADEVEKLLHQILVTGEPVRDIELTGETQAQPGVKRTWMEQWLPLKNDQDQVIGINIVAEEITERKRMEEALRVTRHKADRQQEELQTVLEQSPVAIVIYRGPEYIIELANPLVRKMWNRTKEEVLGRPLFEAVPEANSPEFRALLDGVMRTGEPFVGNEVPFGSNQPGFDAVQYYNFVYQRWQNEQGEATGVIAIASLVTEQVESRRALEAKQQELEKANQELLQVVQEQYRLTALLNNSSDFIGLATPEGQALYINPAGCQLVGIASSTPVAQVKITDFFFAKDVSFVQDTILPTVLEQGRWSGEFQFRHFDTGQAIPVFYTLFTVNDPDTGELLGLATITLDITERQQREAELQSFREQLALTNQELAAANEELRAANEDLYQANDHLQRVNTDLDNFVYTASHDLKAPISNIKGLLSLLAQSLSLESKESPRTQNVLQMMDKSVARFMNTIADLSEIARLEKQSNQPAEPIDLAAVIQEVLEDIALAVEEANAQVLIDITQCSTIRFSPKNLRSVVYNLLSNAVKYRDPLRPPVVLVSCQAAEGYQIFTVADNGLGMNLTEDTKLFGMFQRLHDHVEGTGVGLYIVKKIIDNAGGKIEVTSQVGQGTTFKVFFSVQN